LRLGVRCCAPFIVKHWWWIEALDMSQVEKTIIKKKVEMNE
jgi:hypothetical protein